MLHLLLSDATFSEILKYLNSGGVLGLLALILFGGYRRWWVFGWIYKDSESRSSELKRERDDWRDLALHGTNLAEQTVNLFRTSGKDK